MHSIKHRPDIQQHVLSHNRPPHRTSPRPLMVDVHGARDATLRVRLEVK